MRTESLEMLVRTELLVTLVRTKLLETLVGAQLVWVLLARGAIAAVIVSASASAAPGIISVDATVNGRVFPMYIFESNHPCVVEIPLSLYSPVTG